MCPVGVFPGAGAGFFDGNVRKISPKGRTQADSLGILHYLCAFGRNGMDRLSEIREPLEKVFGEYEEFMKRALYSDKLWYHLKIFHCRTSRNQKPHYSDPFV